MNAYRTPLDLIGQSPLLVLDRIHPDLPGRLFAKAEFLQPGGSIKDRAARRILERARETGDLQPGQTVIEMTSGNMGAGLAVVCNLLGHPFVAFMSEGNSPQRAAMLRALGAEVVLIPQVDGAPGQVTGPDIDAAVKAAQQRAAECRGYYVDQFNNPGSLEAHIRGTGPEIWDALGERIDAFVAAVGSGGTLVGTAIFLKEQNPKIHCSAVEPAGAEILAGKPVIKPRHTLQGTGYALIPPHWRPELIDTYLSVDDATAQRYRQLLAHREGLHVGFSAAANVAASVDLLRSGRLPDGAVVVTVLCDTGLKYAA